MSAANQAAAARVWVAGAGEAADVARLLGAFRDWFGRDDPDDGALLRSVERLLRDPDTEYLLGARAGEPAGVCQLRYRYGVWHSGEDCWLEDLYVEGSARGTGLGSALLEAALERARARGARRVELDVNERNPARTLYERHGFSSYSDPPGGHNLLMRLPLEGEATT